MTKKANKQAKTQNTNKTQSNNILTMQDVFDYVETLAKTNNKIMLQSVTGYVALKYGNKTICELHNKKRSIPHITFSNKSKAMEIAEKADAVHRVVPDSYGWRLNTECLLNANLQKVIKQILDSLIAETEEQFNAKQQKQQQKQQKAKKVA